jgi:hypothetical protein
MEIIINDQQEQQDNGKEGRGDFFLGFVVVSKTVSHPLENKIGKGEENGWKSQELWSGRYGVRDAQKEQGGRVVVAATREHWRISAQEGREQSC